MRGETMKQPGQVSQKWRGQGSASEPCLQHDTEYDQLGIVIFARGQKLLHVNRRAKGLTGHLDLTEIGTDCESDSAPVHELRNAIQEALDQRRAANIWEPFELKRVIFEANRMILVRGLGLADRSEHGDSRIVIVLEELGPRQARSEP